MEERGASILDHWLLAGIQPRELQPLLANAHRVRFLPNEVIFEEGDAPDGLYLIAEGSVRVTATNERGEVLLATVGAHSVLGEMGVLDGEPRSGTATAAEHCTAYFIPAERFLDALELSPRLCMRLLALLTERLRQANEPLKRFPHLVAADDPFASQPVAPGGSEPRPPPREPIDLQAQRDPKGFFTPETEGFYEWLVRRVDLADRVGDLARHARDDPQWPRDATDVDRIQRYLELRDADPTLVNTLNAAWRSWQVATQRAGLVPDFEDL